MILGESVDQFGFPVEAAAVKKETVDTAHEVDRMIVQEHIRLEREKQMNAAKLLEEIERKIAGLSEAEKQEEEPEKGSDLYDVVLDDEALERFADGLLTVLGELETEKLIPPIESAGMARDALLAVVRQLYQRKNSIGKMSRKFARFGAKQFLKRQRALISRSLG
jgi:hypothetical protein